MTDPLTTYDWTPSMIQPPGCFVGWADEWHDHSCQRIAQHSGNHHSQHGAWMTQDGHPTDGPADIDPATEAGLTAWERDLTEARRDKTTVTLRLDRELHTIEVTATGPDQEANALAVTEVASRPGGLMVLLEPAARATGGVVPGAAAYLVREQGEQPSGPTIVATGPIVDAFKKRLDDEKAKGDQAAVQDQVDGGGQ